MRNIVIAAFTTALIVALTTTAFAQTDTAAEAAQPAGQTAGALRAQCEDALLQDAQWRADLKKQLASEVHEEDAELMLTNKKHVVMAYAALWILVVVFVVFMWMKQRGLKAELARLESEIREAAKEGEA